MNETIYPTPDWLMQYGCDVRDLFGLNDWDITILVVDAEDLDAEHDDDENGPGCRWGDCTSNIRSLTARIRLRHDLNDDQFRDTLMHELLHVRLALLDHVVKVRIVELLPARLQGHAHGLYDDAMEQTIESLTRTLRRGIRPPQEVIQVAPYTNGIISAERAYEILNIQREADADE